jgi:transposase
MPQGVKISRDLKQVIYRMKALDLSTKTISHYTGIPIQTIQDIIHRFNTTSNSEPKKWLGRIGKIRKQDAKVGRDNAHFRFILTCLQYLISLIEKKPEAQLPEYQKWLLEDRGLDVSTAIISRTLYKCGYSLKTVCKTTINSRLY